MFCQPVLFANVLNYNQINLTSYHAFIASINASLALLNSPFSCMGQPNSLHAHPFFLPKNCSSIEAFGVQSPEIAFLTASNSLWHKWDLYSALPIIGHPNKFENASSVRFQWFGSSTRIKSQGTYSMLIRSPLRSRWIYVTTHKTSFLQASAYRTTCISILSRT